MLSAFLSLHTVRESPAFVIWSALWFSAHYSLCKPLVYLGHNIHTDMLTKAPLFNVYISSSGSEKQEIQLPLMRKRLHTPLAVLSTWNPGHCSRKHHEITSVPNKRSKCAWRRNISPPLNSMTNYLLLFCFQCIQGIIESCMTHSSFAWKDIEGVRKERWIWFTEEQNQ